MVPRHNQYQIRANLRSDVYTGDKNPHGFPRYTSYQPPYVTKPARISAIYQLPTYQLTGRVHGDSSCPRQLPTVSAWISAIYQIPTDYLIRRLLRWSDLCGIPANRAWISAIYQLPTYQLTGRVHGDSSCPRQLPTVSAWISAIYQIPTDYLIRRLLRWSDLCGIPANRAWISAIYQLPTNYLQLLTGFKTEFTIIQTKGVLVTYESHETNNTKLMQPRYIRSRYGRL
jgi:hypothetical protein